MEPFAIQEETVSTEFAPETHKKVQLAAFEGAALNLILSHIQCPSEAGGEDCKCGGGG